MTEVEGREMEEDLHGKAWLDSLDRTRLPKLKARRPMLRTGWGHQGDRKGAEDHGVGENVEG